MGNSPPGCGKRADKTTQCVDGRPEIGFKSYNARKYAYNVVGTPV